MFFSKNGPSIRAWASGYHDLATAIRADGKPVEGSPVAAGRPMTQVAADGDDSSDEPDPVTGILNKLEPEVFPSDSSGRLTPPSSD